MPKNNDVLEDTISVLSKELVSGSIRKRSSVVINSKKISDISDNLKTISESVGGSGIVFKPTNFQKKDGIKIKTVTKETSDPIWLM